jgi:broad specificity phosphatase PhoE
VRKTTVLLVRHAHTMSNGRAPTLSGWSDLPLTDLGRRQVCALRQAYAGARFAAVLSSPLDRALKTADAFAPGNSIELCSDLREIHCGHMEGMLVEKIMADCPELWSANLRQDDDEFRWPGGESYREFRARCLQALGRIASLFDGERVVVVTHTGFVGQVLGALAGIRAARWDAFRPGNASITELVWSDTERRVVRFDDRSHLREQGVESS